MNVLGLISQLIGIETLRLTVQLLMKNMLLLGIHKFKYLLYYLSTFFVTVL